VLGVVLNRAERAAVAGAYSYEDYNAEASSRKRLRRPHGICA
jgi:hypothetical protein